MEIPRRLTIAYGRLGFGRVTSSFNNPRRVPIGFRGPSCASISISTRLTRAWSTTSSGAESEDETPDAPEEDLPSSLLLQVWHDPVMHRRL